MLYFCISYDAWRATSDVLVALVAMRNESVEESSMIIWFLFVVRMAYFFEMNQ
jgi:hypothetical protein